MKKEKKEKEHKIKFTVFDSDRKSVKFDGFCG